MNEYTATVAVFRTALLRHALDAAGGNRTHAARARAHAILSVPADSAARPGGLRRAAEEQKTADAKGDRMSPKAHPPTRWEPLSTKPPQSSRPPIYIDDQGLPRCSRCTGEDNLCTYHKAQVTEALNNLKSPNILARSERDVRYLIRHRDKYAERDEIQAAAQSPGGETEA